MLYIVTAKWKNGQVEIYAVHATSNVDANDKVQHRLDGEGVSEIISISSVPESMFGNYPNMVFSGKEAK